MKGNRSQIVPAAAVTLNRVLRNPAPRASQGCKPRGRFAGGPLVRNCAVVSAPRSGKCLRIGMKTGRSGSHAVP
ncbi:hypothetical protein J2Y48_004028 [Mycoplana sp. BE70]|nr:hypothetical protein [Mycoplana sp. BE70]